jgi:hypothetical protein
MVLDLVGQPSGARVAFIPPVSIEDHSLLGPWSSHRLIIPSTYLLMGAGRLVTLLSWVLTLSGPTVIDGLLGWRSKHHTEAGSAVLGAWSPSLAGTWTP